MIPVYSLLLVCVLPIPSAHEAAGATGIRRSPRPLLGGSFINASGASRREGATVCLDVVAICRRCERSGPDSVIPGRCEASNPESRDSGSGPADHPGMTAYGLLRRFSLRSLSYGGQVALAMTANRNDVQHTFAPLRREAPEALLNLPPNRGRRERRVPAAPAASCALE